MGGWSQWSVLGLLVDGLVDISPLLLPPPPVHGHLQPVAPEFYHSTVSLCEKAETYFVEISTKDGKYVLKTSAVNPDPYLGAFWIRIRNTDPDPQKYTVNIG